MSEDAVQYAYGAVNPRQLVTARLRAAWEYLSEVAGDADVLPEPVRHAVAQALAYTMEARAGLAQGEQ